MTIPVRQFEDPALTQQMEVNERIVSALEKSHTLAEAFENSIRRLEEVYQHLAQRVSEIEERLSQEVDVR